MNETHEQKVARADHDRKQLRMPVTCNACDRIVPPGEGIDVAGRCADCETESCEPGIDYPAELDEVVNPADCETGPAEPEGCTSCDGTVVPSRHEAHCRVLAATLEGGAS